MLKLVASRSPAQATGWQNSTVLAGDLAATWAVTEPLSGLEPKCYIDDRHGIPWATAGNLWKGCA
jgi:hypothetical protein